jgi:hypothetical protein
MLGIKTGFSFFQKEADLVDAIFRKDKNEVEKCLSLLSILKASDTDWLRKTFEFELGIRKETSAEKASEILSQENVKTIKKFAGKVEYEGIVTKIFPKGLSLSIIIGCLATFIVSFHADFSSIAAFVSIVALGFVLFTAAYTSPLALRKFKVIEEWRFIISIIIVLIFGIALYGTYQSYPKFEQKDLISNWAGNVATLMGFLFGAVLYLCERAKLENWWRKHSGKVMGVIIFMVVAGYLYVDNCIIAGRVVFEDETDEKKKYVSGAVIRVKGVSGIQDELCYDEPSEFSSDKADDGEITELCNTISSLSSDLTCNNIKELNTLLKSDKFYNELEKKYKNIQKQIPAYISNESGILRKNRLMLELIYPDKIPMKEKTGWFYENFIKGNKLCTTTTNDNGDFSFRFFPVALESKQVGFQFKYEERNYNGFRDIKLGVRKIEPPFYIFKLLPFEGIWKCSYGENINFEWNIKRVNDKIVTEISGTAPPNNCFKMELNYRETEFYSDDCKIEYEIVNSKLIIKKINGRSQDNFSCSH